MILRSTLSIPYQEFSLLSVKCAVSRLSVSVSVTSFGHSSCMFVPLSLPLYLSCSCYCFFSFCFLSACSLHACFCLLSHSVSLSSLLLAPLSLFSSFSSGVASFEGALPQATHTTSTQSFGPPPQTHHVRVLAESEAARRYVTKGSPREQDCQPILGRRAPEDRETSPPGKGPLQGACQLWAQLWHGTFSEEEQRAPVGAQPGNGGAVTGALVSTSGVTTKTRTSRLSVTGENMCSRRLIFLLHCTENNYRDYFLYENVQSGVTSNNLCARCV